MKNDVAGNSLSLVKVRVCRAWEVNQSVVSELYIGRGKRIPSGINGIKHGVWQQASHFRFLLEGLQC